MSKQNCWEFKKCGRELGGVNAGELGVCPASMETRTNGINHGKNGGRACWAISGTMCGNKVQGTYAMKIGNCLNCHFYQQVQREEKPRFVTSVKILELLKNDDIAE